MIIHFLTYSKDKWCDFDRYKKLKMFISNLKVVNNVTERGVRIRLKEEFKDILTDDEEQKGNVAALCRTFTKMFS